MSKVLDETRKHQPRWPSPDRTRLDPVLAYAMMLRMRASEEALVRAWADGLVPGEYHSGIGEEGIVAGVALHLRREDTVSLDHRNTAPFIARGAALEPLILEILGSEAGMNHGWAGHMHLFDPDLRAGSDGIVGSAAPLAVGCALALSRLEPGGVAIAFHGDGAMNQGMVMEAYNLAVAWQLPVVFVCKDNDWSITTHTRDLTGGGIAQRARSFGLTVESVRGDRVEEVHTAAGRLIARARAGKGPGFLHATCHRPGGHFEGDPLVRIMQHPIDQANLLAPGLTNSLRETTGAARTDRVRGLAVLTHRVGRAARDWTLNRHRDPIRHARGLLDADTAARIETEVAAEVSTAVMAARARLAPRPVFGTNRGGSR